MNSHALFFDFFIILLHNIAKRPFSSSFEALPVIDPKPQKAPATAVARVVVVSFAELYRTMSPVAQRAFAHTPAKIKVQRMG